MHAVSTCGNVSEECKPTWRSNDTFEGYRSKRAKHGERSSDVTDGAKLSAETRGKESKVRGNCCRPVQCKKADNENSKLCRCMLQEDA